MHASAASLQGLDDGQWRAAHALLPGPPNQRGSYDGTLHDGMFGRLQDMLQLLLTRAPASVHVARDWAAVVGRWLMWIVWVGIPSSAAAPPRSGSRASNPVEPLDVPALVFSTLLAAVEWVEACAGGHQAACIELGQLVLSMLVVDAQRGQDGARCCVRGMFFTDVFFTEVFSGGVTRDAPAFAAASSVAAALLHGELAVPDALLRKVLLFGCPMRIVVYCCALTLWLR